MFNSEDDKNKDSYSILKIVGDGVELSLGTIDDLNEFEKFNKSAQENQLTPWYAGDDDVNYEEYNEIINIWGLDGDNNENIDSVSLIDKDEKNIKVFDKSNVEMYCIEEPYLSKTSKNGYLGYNDSERGLTVQYELNNRYYKNSDQINIIILYLSTEEVFAYNGYISYGCKYVLVMSNDEKQEILRKYNYSQFENLISDLRDNFEEETEIVIELKKFVLKELDVTSESTDYNAIHLFNKYGKRIYYSNGDNVF